MVEHGFDTDDLIEKETARSLIKDHFMQEEQDELDKDEKEHDEEEHAEEEEDEEEEDEEEKDEFEKDNPSPPASAPQVQPQPKEMADHQ